MADILIRDFKMPTNCDDCHYDFDCAYDEHQDGYKMVGCRPCKCPLNPLQPHGNLIDADALKAWFIEWYDLDADLEVRHFLDILTDETIAPIVISASE